MTVASVTEISGVSPEGFEAAIREALERANKTLRNIEGAPPFGLFVVFLRSRAVGRQG